jgi:protein TonB
MSATVNAFPPLHAFNSSRSWFLALIVLLHMGFFWALTNGLTVYIWEPGPRGEVVLISSNPVKPPPPRVIDVDPTVSRVFVPVIETPNLRTEEETSAPQQVTREPPPPTREVVAEQPGSGPVIVDPQGDSRYPLTEPEYPVAEIRLQHEGTVWLSIQVLPNGRVGAVRVDQSSGFVKLDESAMREARRWRMKPGTQDGVATAMWKRVPVTFRLKD